MSAGRDAGSHDVVAAGSLRTDRCRGLPRQRLFGDQAPVDVDEYMAGDALMIDTPHPFHATDYRRELFCNRGASGTVQHQGHAFDLRFGERRPTGQQKQRGKQPWNRASHRKSVARREGIRLRPVPSRLSAIEREPA